MIEETKVEAAFRKALDAQGHGFQYAVLREVQEAHHERAPWWPAIHELPVEVRGRDTRVDFVLHNGKGAYMVCECKRANPAVANWCFARAAWPSSKHGSYSMAFSITRAEAGAVSARLRELLSSDNAYQIALDVRATEQGDTAGTGRGSIEEAAGQVCRGLNGFAQFLAARPSLLRAGSTATLIPVIFTTASLWASAADIGVADLSTGKLPVGELKLESREWLWLDYPQSAGLQHEIRHHAEAESLRDVFFGEALRRIAVVSPAGIRPFLKSQLWEWW